MPRMEVPRLVVLLHVLAAFAWVAGYTATNLLTEFARRSDDAPTRRQALAFSSRFDRLLNAPGGGAVAITGLLAAWAFGYSLLTPWLLASIALYLAILALGIIYWARFGKRVDTALASSDESAVTAILREPRSVLVSRGENLMLVIIVVLMVLRPGS
jgi:uncharacterized membrane protein